MSRTVKPSYRFYRRAYRVARAGMAVLFRFEVKGRENIPTGAAMVCSNHSSSFDPLFIAFAFGIDCFMHFIAKIELYRFSIVAFVMKKLGTIRVNRGMMDVATIKMTLEYFANNEKVAIFPEGTRTSETEHVAAKNGAVKIAERAGVPLIPVFVPRRKKLFRKVTLVIGEPYYIEKQSEKRSSDEYLRLAEQLMSNIEALKPTIQSAHNAEN